jgi:hypothetical protein
MALGILVAFPFNVASRKMPGELRSSGKAWDAYNLLQRAVVAVVGQLFDLPSR